jgi:hypothetical protein
MPQRRCPQTRQAVFAQAAVGVDENHVRLEHLLRPHEAIEVFDDATGPKGMQTGLHRRKTAEVVGVVAQRYFMRPFIEPDDALAAQQHHLRRGLGRALAVAVAPGVAEGVAAALGFVLGEVPGDVLPQRFGFQQVKRLPAALPLPADDTCPQKLLKSLPPQHAARHLRARDTAGLQQPQPALQFTLFRHRYSVCFPR